MPHPIPLWLSLSLSAALLLAAASSQAQPSPGYNRFLSPEVNAALADPQLPVRKYRDEYSKHGSGWTKRFETCISQPAPDLSDPRRQCIAEEIINQLRVTGDYHQSLLGTAKERFFSQLRGERRTADRAELLFSRQQAGAGRGRRGLYCATGWLGGISGGGLAARATRSSSLADLGADAST
ncbi:hypothetical protein [Stenotrophomonas koreensis]|uniref:hypothetical protein n=1 Tax=Stenotrophomonas koreensis TaxID=266128 RepID=UPI000A9F2199|nr:hypothetical protein [Stenotrophomonas koreensis]